MSHFTVMVVGDDVAAALAPFHQFECTGLDDRYVQSIDETEYRNIIVPMNVLVHGDLEGQKYTCDECSAAVGCALAFEPYNTDALVRILAALRAHAAKAVKS